MSRRRTAALLAASVPFAARAALAQPAASGAIAIRHVPIACVVAGAFPRVDACFAPPDALSRARVRFRADDRREWYVVEMAPEGACYAATLPRPLASTGRVRYAIEAVGRGSEESRTGEFVARVARDRDGCGGVAAPAVAEATVRVRSADSGAPAVPPGFSAAGLVRGHGGHGGAVKALALGGAVVAAGVTAAILAGGKETDPADVDDDRDGFSERQGDCNDADASVHPGGDVQFTIDFAFSGTTACGARNAQQQVYRVVNHSCDAVAVQSLQIALTLGGTCTGGESYAVSLEATQVAAGASAVVRRGAPAGAVAPLCCQAYPCTAGACTVSLQYALGTSAGTRTLAQAYSIADPSGRDCPLCAGTGTDETLRPVSGGSGGLVCRTSLPPY